jgi:hypothetical protein
MCTQVRFRKTGSISPHALDFCLLLKCFLTEHKMYGFRYSPSVTVNLVVTMKLQDVSSSIVTGARMVTRYSDRNTEKPRTV